MNRLSEAVKIDNALTPASLNSAGTGSYFPMGEYRKALFAVVIGAMAAGVTSVLQVMQATNAAAGSAKVVTNNAATITANTNVASAIFTAASTAAADTCVVNGITFTAIANGATPSGNQFAVGTGGTADADTATALAAAINAAGISGITASAASAVVTIVASEPGEASVSVTGTAVRLVAATVRAVAYVECDAAFLDNANGFNHVALRVTNSAAALTGAVLIRGNSRYTPVQYVAASKVDVVA